MKPLKVETIADLIDGDYGLTACCEAGGCYNSADLDLEALARRLGRDHSSMHDALTPLLRCSKCGSRKIGIRLSANASQMFGTPQGWLMPPKLSDGSANPSLGSDINRGCNVQSVSKTAQG